MWCSPTNRVLTGHWCRMREYHGPHPDDEYNALSGCRQSPVEPDGGCCNGCCFGSTYAYAVHSGDTGAVGDRGADGIMFGNFPTALDNVSQLMCIWGGVITFTDAGEETV